MATQVDGILHHLCRAGLLGEGGGLTDGQLLERYIARRDETAFAVLLRRHGPMVLGVCRRIVGNFHDAEDAFQATFLVLTCKAASIVPRELVGNWLHGVAYHTALKAKAMNSKRRAKEREAATVPRPEDTESVWRQLEPLLDRALQELPDKFRVPIVLCDLEGKTRREAARQLGWAEGTVASRLARGRGLLAQRLARHGLALSGAVIAAALAHNTASAAMPGPIVASTIKAASLFAAGHTAMGEMMSAKVVALTKGTLKVMLLTKLKTATTVLCAVAFLAMSGFVLRPAPSGVLVSAACPKADSPKDENKGELPKTVLKWRFEKGKTFYQKMTTTTDQTMKVMNQDVQQTQTQTFYYSYTPLQQNGNTWIVKQRIEGVQMDMNIGGTKSNYDSRNIADKNNPLNEFFAALVGAEFTITLNTKDMTVTKLEGHKDLADKLAKANPQMQELITQILSEKALRQVPESLFSLPGVEKAIGDTWTRKTALEMGPGLGVSDKAVYTYEGKDLKDPKLDKIGVQHTLRIEALGNGGNGGVPFKVTSADLKTIKASGTIHFNAASGRIVRSNVNQELEGTLKIEIGGQTTEVTLKQTQKSAVETNDKSLLPPAMK